jgi:hypothetical protein
MATIVATYELVDKGSQSYDVAEIYSDGTVLIKSAAGVIRTRHNPTGPVVTSSKKTASRIDAEVDQILEQLGVDDSVSRRLATAWVSGKAQSLSSGLELLRRNSADDKDTVTIEQWGVSAILITGGPFEGHYGDCNPMSEEDRKRVIAKILSL